MWLFKFRFDNCIKVKETEEFDSNEVRATLLERIEKLSLSDDEEQKRTIVQSLRSLVDDSYYLLLKF